MINLSAKNIVYLIALLSLLILISIRLWFINQLDLKTECYKLAENQPTKVTREQCIDLDFEY
jgi:hypothetical protein